MAGPRSDAFSFRSFNCCVCLQDTFGVPILIHKEKNLLVDHDCATQMIIPIFQKALKNEFEFPPRWGQGVILEYQHCLHLLPSGFEAEYKAKDFEYRSPIALRLYCQEYFWALNPGSADTHEVCGKFLGHRCNDPLRAMVFRCPECEEEGYDNIGWCTYCGGRVPYLERAYVEHACCPADKDVEGNFEGLVRGRDYQICPAENCGLKVELREACNRLICPSFICRTHFCAICGEPAKHGSGHWNLGMPCPMWNRPGDSNAQFDPSVRGVAQGVQAQLQGILPGAVASAAPRLNPPNGRQIFRQACPAPGVKMDIPGSKPIRISRQFVASERRNKDRVTEYKV